MRFTEEFKTKTVQAWKNKYVRYSELKQKLAELRQLYQEHNLRNNSINVPIPSQIKEDSLLKDERRHPILKDMTSLYSTIRFNNIKTMGGNKRSRQDSYQFNDVATVVEPDLSSKIPVIDSQLYEIKAKEKEFVLWIEQDIFTVSKFYAQQCLFFAKQHNVCSIT